MPVLTLNLPDDIEKELSDLKVRKEEFIINALKEKINLQKSDTLKAVLTEGYKNNHTENEELTKDFFQTDLENWDEY